jgi:hypothetical protein
MQTILSFDQINTTVSNAHNNYLMGRSAAEAQINREDSNVPARPYNKKSNTKHTPDG